MIGGALQVWERNSPDYDPLGKDRLIWVHIIAAASVVILVHSAVIHGRSYPTVRFLVDVAAASTALSCACLYVLVYVDCSRALGLLLVNVLVQCVFGVLNQLVDNYFLLVRWMALESPRPALWVLANLYILLLLIGTYWPFYTVLPFFFDINDEYHPIKDIATAIYLISYLVYNITLGSIFMYRICRAWRMASALSAVTDANSRIAVHGARVIFQCIMSSLGVVLQALEDPLDIAPLGTLTSMLLIVIPMHFFFNAPGLVERMRSLCSMYTQISKANGLVTDEDTAILLKLNFNAIDKAKRREDAGRSRKIISEAATHDDTSLDEILLQPMLRDLFADYCRGCFCEESCLFLLEVLHFKEIAWKGMLSRQKLTQLATMCKSIVDEYIQVGSAYEVNISSTMRKQTLDRSTAFIQKCTVHSTRASSRAAQTFMKKGKDRKGVKQAWGEGGGRVLPVMDENIPNPVRLSISQPSDSVVVPLSPGRERSSASGVELSGSVTAPSVSTRGGTVSSADTSSSALGSSEAALEAAATGLKGILGPFGMVMSSGQKTSPSGRDRESSALGSRASGSIMSGRRSSESSNASIATMITAQQAEGGGGDRVSTSGVGGVLRSTSGMGGMSGASSWATVLELSALNIPNEAAQVFEIAYVEVSKMLSNNLLTAFKSSPAYKTVGMVNAMSPTANVMQEGVIRSLQRISSQRA